MELTAVALQGRHVRLEPLASHHLDALVHHAADPAVWEFISLPPMTTLAAAQTYLERTRAEFARKEALAFAVVHLAKNEAVGTTTYFDVSAIDRRLEIGRTWLGRSVWRTAVNTEAKRLLLQHAFETLGCLRVQLKADQRNTRSQAAIERLGAVKEGVLRAHMRRPDGTQRDTVMFSIIVSEWPAVKARLDGFLSP